MDDSRAQTLATLDAFLESQRDLLARTQADLYKLAELRERALDNPEEFIENVEEELDDPAFKMSEYHPPRIPEDIDWGLFSSAADPTAFSKVPIPGPSSVSKKQQSPPSELQLLVRQAATDILADFRPFEMPEEEDDAEVAAEAAEEAANERRLAELVNAGKKGDPPVVASSEPPLPRRRVGSALRLKHENEAPANDAKTRGKVGKGDSARQSPKKETEIQPVVRLRSQRLRRPTIRPDEIYSPISPAIPSPQLPQTPTTPQLLSPEPSLPLPDPDGLTTAEDDMLSDNAAASPDSAAVPATAVSRHKKKKKDDVNKPGGRRSLASETFNLPWSVAEQHLLEKLLEEIPPGEKNRWAKISRAMSGRRTPRQVASRVQKYFEKLKKFGVDPGT